MSGPIGGPFDIREMLGSDRLVFTNSFVGSLPSRPEKIAERAEEIYRGATIHPAEPNESESDVIITGESTFKVEVTIFHPLMSLTAVRDARNELDVEVPNTTLTTVDVNSINVGKTGRTRPVLSSDIWLQFSSRKIVDISREKEAQLESFIRERTDLETKVNVIQNRSNVAIDLNTEQEILAEIIMFASEAGDEIREQLSTDVGRIDIAAGKNFDFRV